MCFKQSIVIVLGCPQELDDKALLPEGAIRCGPRTWRNRAGSEVDTSLVSAGAGGGWLLSRLRGGGRNATISITQR